MSDGSTVDAGRSGGVRGAADKRGRASERASVLVSTRDRGGDRPLPGAGVHVVCGQPGDRVPGRARRRHTSRGERRRQLRRHGRRDAVPRRAVVRRFADHLRTSAQRPRRGRRPGARGHDDRRCVGRVLPGPAHRRRLRRPCAVHRSARRTAATRPDRWVDRTAVANGRTSLRSRCRVAATAR